MYAYKKLSKKEKEEVLKSRRAQGFPLHSPPHLDEPGRWYLITAATYYHKPVFTSPDLLKYLEITLLEALAHNSIHHEAWVVMPNHYHVLVELTGGATDYRKVAERVHSMSGYHANRYEAKQGRRVWYRYADRMIRSERHFYATVNYIHLNPQKHGCCDDYRQWQWSSVHKYVATLGENAVEQMMNQYDLEAFGKGWDDM
jgi:putative transposase